MSEKPPRETRHDSPIKPPEEWDSADFDERRRLALRPRPQDPNQRTDWLRARMDLVWAYRYGYGTEPDTPRYFELLKQMAELDEGSQAGAKWHLALALQRRNWYRAQRNRLCKLDAPRRRG